MKKIYCFGSDIDEGDRVAFDAAKFIKESPINGLELEFEYVKDPYSLYDIKAEELIIMDAVKGIFFVKILEDTNALKQNNPISAHDFDLSLFLQLLIQMGKIKKVKIIGLPYGKHFEEIKDDLISTLKREMR